MVNYKELDKGDTFLFRGKEGVLLSKPKYKCSGRSGLYYADVKVGDKVLKGFMICRTDIEWD